MKQLNVLNISFNKFNNLDFIKNCSNLAILDITKNPLKFLETISTFNQLNFLFMSSDQLSNNIILKNVEFRKLEN